MNQAVQVDTERLRAGLHHRHLPALADHDFVEWETDPLIARRGERFEEVAAIFRALESQPTDLPGSLVVGCRRLESERQTES